MADGARGATPRLREFTFSAEERGEPAAFTTADTSKPLRHGQNRTGNPRHFGGGAACRGMKPSRTARVGGEKIAEPHTARKVARGRCQRSRSRVLIRRLGVVSCSKWRSTRTSRFQRVELSQRWIANSRSLLGRTAASYGGERPEKVFRQGPVRRRLRECQRTVTPRVTVPEQGAAVVCAATSRSGSPVGTGSHSRTNGRFAQVVVEARRAFEEHVLN